MLPFCRSVRLAGGRDSAVALKSKAFRIIRARGSRVRSGLAAGGSRIRTLGPALGVRAPVAEQGFRVHRPATIEARLYLNGEYQTLVERQAKIQGGPDDLEFAAGVRSVTESLLGPYGAYRAIDPRQHATRGIP